MTGAGPPVIAHLPGIRNRKIPTGRLSIYALETGGPGDTVLFLHGNAASSTYWEEVMLGLPAGFRGLAPDLRGYGLTDRAASIDARRGVGDWVDDVHALLETLGVDRFHLVGHSMGGMIAWGVLADSRLGGRVRSATLVAPGPPCGFGGLHGPDGVPNHPDFSGSGAGLVDPRFAGRIARGDRSEKDPAFSPRVVMNRVFWKPPFRPAREEDLLSALLQIHVGERAFPGDFVASSHWPGFAPGQYGPINAMSGRHNQDLARRLLAQPRPPPLLVVLGADDLIICDASPSDPAVQGKMKLRPGWPGEAVFPAQPFRSQVEAAVAGHRAAGGTARQVVLEHCGHSPYLERPQAFRDAFHRFLLGRPG